MIAANGRRDQPLAATVTVSSCRHVGAAARCRAPDSPDFHQLPQPTSRPRQINRIAPQAFPQRPLSQQHQMLVLIVQNINQIDKPLLGRNGTLSQTGQFIDDPVIESPAQLQVIHDRRGVVAQVAKGKTNGSPFTVSGLQVPGADGQRNGGQRQARAGSRPDVAPAWPARRNGPG